MNKHDMWVDLDEEVSTANGKTIAWGCALTIAFMITVIILIADIVFGKQYDLSIGLYPILCLLPFTAISVVRLYKAVYEYRKFCYKVTYEDCYDPDIE